MPQIYSKVVDDEGNETYVEANLNEIELPADHPLNVKLNDVFASRKRKTEKVNSLQKQLDELRAGNDDDAGETPEPAVQPVAPMFDPEAFVVQVETRLTAKQEKAVADAAERKANIDTILKDTGLSETLRPVIEAIPDLTQAKAQASLLAKSSLAFGEASAGGNGSKSKTDMLANVRKNLQLTSPAT